jgi:uncharacterized protein (DUF58 family)
MSGRPVAGTRRIDAPHLTLAFTAGAVVAVLLCALGLFFARPDVALLGVPLLIAAAWGWDRRLRPEPSSADVYVEEDTTDQGDGTRLRAELCFETPAGTDLVLLRLRTLGSDSREFAITPATARSVRIGIPVLHSGPQEIVRLEYRLGGTDAATATTQADPVVASRVIGVRYSAAAALPLPDRTRGTTGPHGSNRLGDGGDFRDIHPFQPGDRLRRIDWRATARYGLTAGELFVRRTTATADATVVIVVDSRDDIGENVADWGRNTPSRKGLSSMDVARQAASSLASGYVRAGDRVGFQDLATITRVLRPGAGVRHLHRVLSAIEQARPAGAPGRRERPPVVAPGALLYVLSTFLDGEASRMAVSWASAGHRVLAVDVLPAPDLSRLDREEHVAYRIVMMEREDRIRSLEAYGVDIVRWAGAEEPDVQLRVLSRPTRRGR